MSLACESDDENTAVARGLLAKSVTKYVSALPCACVPVFVFAQLHRA